MQLTILRSSFTEVKNRQQVVLSIGEEGWKKRIFSFFFVFEGVDGLTKIRQKGSRESIEGKRRKFHPSVSFARTDALSIESLVVLRGFENIPRHVYHRHEQ